MRDSATLEASENGADTSQPLISRITNLRLEGRNVLFIEKRKVALNLVWVAKGEKTIKAQAEQVTSFSQKHDHYALFAEGRQIGFGASDGGLEPNMVAAATMFDPVRFGRTFLAAFQVGPDQWWIVAHRDGLVYEDALVMGGESDARVIFNNNMKAPDWTSIIAPSDWMVPDAQDLSLVEATTKTGAIVKPVSYLQAYGGRIAIGALLLVGAAAAFYAWTWYQDFQAQQQAEIDRRQAELVQASMPKIVPYDKLPRLGSFVADCSAAFENMVLFAPGWSQNTLNCAVSSGKMTVDTSWSRVGGRIQYLLAAKEDDLPAAIFLDPAGERASLSYSAEVTPEDLGRNAWEASQVETKLRQRFQALGLEITLRPQIQRLTTTQQRALKDPVYNYHEVTIDTSARLDEYIQLLSDVPLVAAQNLVYDLAQSKWSLTFRIYHPTILPPPPST